MATDKTATDTTDINQAAAELADAEANIAREYGFKADDGELFYQRGTKLWDVGLEASKKYADEYAKLPTTDVAAAELSKTIAAEQRRDRVFSPGAWKLDEAGRFLPKAPLVFEGKEGKPSVTIAPEQAACELNATAWSQLGQRQATLVDPLPAPWHPDYPAAKEHRDAVPPAILKAWQAPRGNVNVWLPHVKGEAKARVRNAPDGSGRQMFSVVSPRYTDYDGDRVLADIAKALPGTKCELRYDADKTETRARVYVQAPVDVPAFVGVGRVHQAGIEFRTRDDGMASLSGRGFLVRVRCKNHSLTQENATKIKRRHIGDQSDLVGSIQSLLGTIPGMIEDLRGLWGRAAANHYLDTDGTVLSVEEALTRLVHHGHVPSGGLTVENAVENYLAAWRAEESPTSAAGILMAVQRAAHEGSWRTKWATDEIEESASTLLYQQAKVCLLAPVETAAQLEMS